MKGLSKILVNFLVRCMPEDRTAEYKPIPVEPYPGLEREEQLAELANCWNDWEPAHEPPPLGWEWLKDNMLDSWCLVRYCRGRLDRITRREWYKAYRRVNRKMRSASTEE